MPRVYLVGPITGLDYKGATDWRDFAKEELSKYGIEALSPMRCKEYLLQERIIKSGYSDLNVLSKGKGITTRDRNDVMTSDLILANFLGATKVSIGSVLEYAWADAFRKPIITVIEKEGNVHEHAMLNELTGFRVETLEAGILVARAVLNR